MGVPGEGSDRQRLGNSLVYGQESWDCPQPCAQERAACRAEVVDLGQVAEAVYRGYERALTGRDGESEVSSVLSECQRPVN